MFKEVLSIDGHILRAALVLGLMFAIPGVTLAQSDVCVPTVGGLAGAPTIDGVVEGDPGWNRSVRVNLGDGMGGVPRRGSVQLIRDGSNLYMSFEVEGVPAPNVDDTVVLGFSTTGNATQDWRVHILPFTAADAGTAPESVVYQDHGPQTSSYWRNSGTWNTAALPGSTPFIGNIKVSRNSNNWSMEMRIPISSASSAMGSNTLLYVPSSGSFGFYANVLSTSSLASTFSQDPWPRSVTMLTAGAPGAGSGVYAENRTPLPSAWGTMALNVTPPRTCTAGVYMTTNSLGVRQVSGGPISTTSRTVLGPFQNGVGTPLNTPAECQTLTDDYLWPATKGPNNYFVATPGNDGPPADGVFVKFYVAPWGIPGTSNAYWHPVGELHKPLGASNVSLTADSTIPTDTSPGVPALTSPVQTSLPWQLSYKQSCVYVKSNQYGALNRGHHCIQADVQSNDSRVVIKNKSVQFNHDFLAASVALTEARISVVGRGRPPIGQKNHEMLIFTDKVIQTFNRDGDRYYPSQSRMSADKRSALPSQFRDFGPVPAHLYPKGLTEGLTFIAKGYLKRDDSLIIGSKRYQYAEYVGGFSYLAGHAGEAKGGWTETLESLGASELKTVGRDEQQKAYVLQQIPEEGTVSLGVRAEAIEEVKGTTTCGTFSGLTKIGANDDAETLAASLLMLGSLGVGGLAFLRRRRPEPQEQEKEDDKA